MNHKPVQTYHVPLKKDRHLQRQQAKLLKIEAKNRAKRNTGVGLSSFMMFSARDSENEILFK